MRSSKTGLYIVYHRWYVFQHMRKNGRINTPYIWRILKITHTTQLHQSQNTNSCVMMMIHIYATCVEQVCTLHTRWAHVCSNISGIVVTHRCWFSIDGPHNSSRVKSHIYKGARDRFVELDRARCLCYVGWMDGWLYGWHLPMWCTQEYDDGLCGCGKHINNITTIVVMQHNKRR